MLVLLSKNYDIYRIAEKFGGELNLLVWQSAFATAKLKSANISYSHIYVWQSLTELPNLNPPIFLQWRFGPNCLIPANISGSTLYYTTGTCTCVHDAKSMHADKGPITISLGASIQTTTNMT